MLIDGVLTWQAIGQFLQTSSLVALALLLATGTLIPRMIVEKLILAPRDQRIEALEKSMAEKEAAQRRLLEEFAGALKTNTQVVNRLLDQLHVDSRGD